MSQFWNQALSSLSELLMQAGNQYAARLLSLVESAEDAPTPGPAGEQTVLLRVRPMFHRLFKPADLQTISTQMKELDFGDTTYRAVVAPALPNPFGPRTEIGKSTSIPIQLRETIVEALYDIRSYDLPAECAKYGLADGDGEEAYDSKRRYVRTRIIDYTDDQLIALSARVVEDHYNPQLWGLLQLLGAERGVSAEFKNLIFAANGPKPQLILRDAVSNTIEITENAEYCLVYDRPLSEAGLTWAALVDWWANLNGSDDGPTPAAANALHSRLVESLDRGLDRRAERGPEYQVFQTYIELIKKHGFELPALIPQVYLHYDPYTQAQRRAPGPLPRQRMDFLLLLPGRHRVVIEVDGKQHYADDGRASPKLYAEMVAQDRELRLAGYEVYRFGGHELFDEATARPMVRAFFERVLARYGCLN